MGKNEKAYQFLKDSRNGKHLDMCQEWKNLLDEKFPELTEDEGFKKGDWLISDNECDLARYCNLESGYTFKSSENYNHKGLNRGNNGWTTSQFKKATYKQVEEFLKREAERRGFVPGCSYINWQGCEIEKDNGNVEMYDRDNLCMTSGNGLIYKKGKWAEIIPEAKKMTQEEIEKELGYKIEISC